MTENVRQFEKALRESEELRKKFEAEFKRIAEEKSAGNDCEAYVKAAQAVSQVQQFLAERARTKGETVKGELKAARRTTDLAVADLYKTINAMMDLLPSDELTALYTQLKGFELYAKQYYLPKGKDEPEPEPEPEPDPEPTPVTPE